MLLMLSVVLAACDKPVSTETVESLAANPDRLKTLREQCRLNRANLGDALCNAVAEATRRRFLDDETVPYRPPTEQPKF